MFSEIGSSSTKIALPSGNGDAPWSSSRMGMAKVALFAVDLCRHTKPLMWLFQLSFLMSRLLGMLCFLEVMIVVIGAISSVIVAVALFVIAANHVCQNPGESPRLSFDSKKFRKTKCLDFYLWKTTIWYNTIVLKALHAFTSL